MTTAQAPAQPSTRQARSRAPIPTRKPSFDFDSVEQPFWFANNGIVTAVLASLSATFPPGEKEFVRSVMHYRDQITDPTLREQVRGFASQEGQHAYQHRLANEWLDSKGFGASEIVEKVEANIAAMREANGDAALLAVTVSMEHITAILANYMLTHPEVTAKMPETVRELLLWHAVEEVEHKAVAFDVFDAVSGDRDLLRRVFAISTMMFTVETARNSVATIRRLGHRPTLREAVGALGFFLGPRGILPSIAREYLDFFRADFHPWDHDNRHLLEAWMAEREGSAITATTTGQKPSKGRAA